MLPLFTARTLRQKLSAVFLSALVVAVFFVGASPARGQHRLQLKPVRGSSQIRLVYGGRSTVVDLDQALVGTNGTLAGEPPHRHAVWFTAERNGYLYLVARVCSGSPVSNPNAPCGGDRPCAILWIKVDRKLAAPLVHSEVYESCSYNYYDSQVKRTRTALEVHFGAREKKTLIYDNREPDKGLVIASQPASTK